MVNSLYINSLKEPLNVPLSQDNSKQCPDLLQHAYKFALSNCVIAFTLRI